MCVKAMMSNRWCHMIGSFELIGASGLDRLPFKYNMSPRLAFLCSFLTATFSSVCFRSDFMKRVYLRFYNTLLPLNF